MIIAHIMYRYIYIRMEYLFNNALNPLPAGLLMLFSLLIVEVSLLFGDIGSFMSNISSAAAEPPTPASLCDKHLDEGEKGDEDDEEEE